MCFVLQGSNLGNCIGVVMVIVFVLRAVDHEFEPRLGQMKDYKIDICCFSSQHATLRSKKNRLVGLELA